MIAVVILFLVCQTPSAIQLIYTMNATEHTNMTRGEYPYKAYYPLPPSSYAILIFPAINNFVNFLVTLNAATNFLLYCALSDKYRKTVRALVCGRKPMRKSILTSSRYNSARTSTTFFSKSQSNGNFAGTGAQGKNRYKSQKRFSITPEEFTSLQAETERLKYPRLSITTSEKRKNSEV